MDPNAAAQQYEAWQQHYGQNPQQGGGPPSLAQVSANTDPVGYNAYFDKANERPGQLIPGAGSGQWDPPPNYNDQPAYNSVPPPRRGGGGGSFGGPPNRDHSSGGYGSGGGGPPRYDSRGGDTGAPSTNKMIFVSGLPQHANETFIHDVFSNQGPIEINEMTGKPKIKIYSDRGVSKGECTICFANESCALKVVATMNGLAFPGTENIMAISMAQFNSSGGGGRSGGYDSNRGSYGGGRGGGFRGGDRDSGGGFRSRGGGGDRGGFRGGDRDFGSRDRGGGGGYDSNRGGGSYGGGRGGGGGFRGGDRDSGGGFRGRGGGDRGFREGGDRGDRGGFGGGRGGFNNRDSGEFRSRDRDDGGGRSFGGGSRDFGDRGGGFRGGRGAPRGGGDRGGGGGGNAQVREGDWICSCGNNNFAFRRECNSCKAPRADGGGNSGGQMRGPPRSSDSRHRPY